MMAHPPWNLMSRWPILDEHPASLSDGSCAGVIPAAIMMETPSELALISTEP